MRVTTRRARQAQYASESRSRAKEAGRPTKDSVARAALELWLERSGQRHRFGSILIELLAAGFDKDQALDVLDRLVDAHVTSNVDTTDDDDSLNLSSTIRSLRLRTER